VDSDQHDEGLYNATESAVLTSMLKRVETGTLYGLNAVRDGSFRGEVITLDMKSDGVGYSTTNPALTADIVRRIEEVKAQIISGQIQVAATNGQAKQLPGFPQDLKAMDN
jgi:basic membrane protein A